MLFFTALLSCVYYWSYTLHCYTPTATQYSHSRSRTHQLVPSVHDILLRLTDFYYDVLPNRTDCRWRRSSAEREDGGSRVGQVHLHCRREQAIQGEKIIRFFLISFILYYSVHSSRDFCLWMKSWYPRMRIKLLHQLSLFVFHLFWYTSMILSVHHVNHHYHAGIIRHFIQFTIT